MRMRPCMLLPLLAAVLLLSTVELSVSQGAIKYCPKDLTFPKPCEAQGEGSTQCLLDVLGSLGASSMPKNCLCTPAGPSKHTCTCLVVCS